MQGQARQLFEESGAWAQEIQTIDERLEFLASLLEIEFSERHLTAFEVMEALHQINDLRAELERRNLLSVRCPNSFM